MRPSRTLLVDGNRICLDAAADFLAGYPRIRLLEHASSGAQALQTIARMRPDLVLIDFEMRDVNGLKIVRQVKSMKHAPAVIVLSLYESTKYRKHAVASGADGVEHESFDDVHVPRALAQGQAKGKE